MANPMYGSNKMDELHGQVNLSNKYLDNKLAFQTWSWVDLSLRLAADVTDAKARAGLSLFDGQICECLVDGSTGASTVALPTAKKGDLTVFRFAAQYDDTNDMVFSCASGEAFEAGTLVVPVTNLGDDTLYSRRPAYVNSWTQTVATAAGAIKTVASGNNTFTIAGVATDNQTNIGAEIAFFCNADGTWRFGFLGSELGSGALNTTFAFSTV